MSDNLPILLLDASNTALVLDLRIRLDELANDTHLLEVDEVLAIDDTENFWAGEISCFVVDEIDELGEIGKITLHCIDRANGVHHNGRDKLGRLVCLEVASDIDILLAE